MNWINDCLPVAEKAVKAAAAAVYPHVGVGGKKGNPENKLRIDGAAVQAFEQELQHLPFKARVVTGEGESDDAPELRGVHGQGEELLEIGVDPVDGTTPADRGEPSSCIALCLAPKGTLLAAPDTKMWSLIVPQGIHISGITMTDNVHEVLNHIAKQFGINTDELNVFCYSRKYNAEIYPHVVRSGAQLITHSGGTLPDLVAPVINKRKRPLIAIGKGGAVETIVAAAAVMAKGGNINAQFAPEPGKDKEIAAIAERGLSLEKTYCNEELAPRESLTLLHGLTAGPSGLGGYNEPNNLWVFKP